MHSEVEKNTDACRGAANLERGDKCRRQSIKDNKEGEGQLDDVVSYGH